MCWHIKYIQVCQRCIALVLLASRRPATSKRPTTWSLQVSLSHKAKYTKVNMVDHDWLKVGMIWNSSTAHKVESVSISGWSGKAYLTPSWAGLSRTLQTSSSDKRLLKITTGSHMSAEKFDQHSRSQTLDLIVEEGGKIEACYRYI